MGVSISTKGFAPHKHCLYSVPWQTLRVDLLGNWTTTEGAKENLARLTNYIGFGVDRKNPQLRDKSNAFTRTWQVRNLLNAVRMGYSGQGVFESERSKLVEEYRDNLIRIVEEQRLAIRQRHVAATEEDIRADWQTLTSVQKKAIRDNLGGRKKKHADSEFRNELGWFLSIINSMA